MFAVTSSDVILLLVIIAFALLLFGFFFVFSWWLSRQKDSLSPYLKVPLRRGSDIAYFSAERVLRYLYSLHQEENEIFDLKRAAFCRVTGRIFPDALTWYNRIKVDWTFLQKRYPGHYVSWGSLSELQKKRIREHHGSLEGFQTELSSPIPSPRFIEREHALSVPGPLYVDIESMVLLGWKLVPDTDLEVLIVQKPTK